MSENSRGRVFILSAPSGAGKSSLAAALLECEPGLGVAVSHTTRPPRPGESPGVHYHFVDDLEFQSLLARDEFLEHAQVFGYRYGTSRMALESLRRAGLDVLLDIDWQGARRIKEQIPDAVAIYLLPPSLEALEARLRGRGQDSPEVIARRMAAAQDEMSHCTEFDHVVINDHFDLALHDLRHILHHGTPVRPRDPAFEARMSRVSAGASR